MLVELIYEHAKTQPKKLAIVINGQPVNYRDFASYIAFFRELWAKQDLPPGSVAVVISPNLMLCWIATLALQSLGLITVSADKISVLKGLNIRKVSCTLMVKTTLENVDSALSFWPDALRLEMPPR